MIDPRNSGKLGHAPSFSDYLIQRHAENVATGNSRLQAAMLPVATTSNPVICHLAPMDKRGDPLVGRRLREARDRVGLSQEQLARDAAVGRSTIAGIEAAQRHAGRHTLMKLSNFFRVPVDYFTNRDDMLATAMWVLGRLPQDELASWVNLMLARATRDKLPPRD